MLELFPDIHWLVVGKLTWLDLMLGGDNAVIIAMACAALPAHLRLRGLIYGTIAAIFMRAAALSVADVLLHIMFIKLIGGLALIYIGQKLLVEDEDDELKVEQKETLWGAVRVIAIADIVMSLDNVIAIVAAAQSAHPPLAYAIAGVVISIPCIVAGAAVVMWIMEKAPIIAWAAGAFLGYLGGEIAMTDSVLAYPNVDLHDIAIQVAGFHISTVGLVGAVVVVAITLVQLRLNKATAE